MNRLSARLQRTREEGRLCLVGFLPAGFPTREGFASMSRAAFAAGVDALEVALPNPPLPLDGPLIQEAGRIGGRNVHSVEDALRIAGDARTSRDQAVIALAYQEAFGELGATGLAEACVRADADAVLMPQHAFADQVEMARVSRAHGLEQVLFLYLEDDLALLASLELENPVIYLQSADLQTGGDFNEGKAHERLGEVRDALGGRDAYVVVGFGVRGPDEVVSMSRSDADGVVVGTSMVAAASRGITDLTELVSSIGPTLIKPPQGSPVDA